MDLVMSSVGLAEIRLKESQVVCRYSAFWRLRAPKDFASFLDAPFLLSSSPTMVGEGRSGNFLRREALGVADAWRVKLRFIACLWAIVDQSCCCYFYWSLDCRKKLRPIAILVDVNKGVVSFDDIRN